MFASLAPSPKGIPESMKSKATQISLLCSIAVVDFFALGIVLTLFAHLFLAPNLFFSAAVSHGQRLHYLGIALALAPIGQLLSNPVWGDLSDRYGRRLLLLITVGGTTVSFLLAALAIQQASYSLLLLAQLLTGIFSGNITVAQASLADMTPHSSKKSGRFNLIQIGIGVGMLLGPWSAAWLLGHHFSVTMPFYLATVLAFLLWLAMWFLFAETRVHQSSASTKSTDWLAGIKQIKAALMAKGLRFTLLAWFVFMLGWEFYMRYFANFLQSSSLQFNEQQVGHLFSYLGLVYLLCQVIIIQPSTKFLPAKKVLVPSGVAVAVFIFLMGLSMQAVFLYLMITCYIVSIALFIPNFNAVLSDRASTWHQGSVFGMAVSLHALSTIIISLIGGYLIIYSVRLPLLIGGVMILLGSMIFIKQINGVKTV